MGHSIRFTRWRILSAATKRLGRAGSLAEVLEVLRLGARDVLRCDGVAVAIRDGDEVEYVGEDAIAPLWAGRRFAIRSCISGLAMIERRMIVVPDIHVDPRVPLNAYLSTFVHGMAVAPIGRGEPVAAVGAYWQPNHSIEEDALILLDMLAKGATAQLERIADQAILSSSS